MRNTISIILFSFIYFGIFAQNDSLKETRDYCFIIQDSPANLFTMRQFNQNYISGYRLFSKGLYAAFKDHKRVADLIQIGLEIFFMPLTHEEGHRSILTANKIGSVSQPYFNKYGAAYVKGVTDQTLQSLRDNNLPTYVRLHTGGLESDYMLTKRMEAIGSFEQDDFKKYRFEYYTRKFALFQYYLVGLFKYEIDLKEESNELDRDIVGFDTYGAARHLYRPNMEFYRYTKYADLTSDERKFVNRLGYRSLLNLLNPLILGIGNFRLTENTRINVGMGYTMSPFGDFIDENVWLKHKTLNVGLYVRQFQNRENWFNGFGISLNDFKPFEKLSTSISGHYWQQPVNFDFNIDKSFTGGAVDMDIKYFFLNKRNVGLKGFSIDLGVIYKTKGYLPEEMYLEAHFGLRMGTTIRL
ncbi:MAG: hypothetical protein P1P88_17070 [Bacteroidales bacterium]|nr:hypothetical protein [Bacteroidales bacterium]